MSGKGASLDQIQRWMQSVIMHPGGVHEGLRSGSARAHLDVGPEDLESVIRPSAALASAERLEIYVDAYFERLLECLREEFAATRTALGDELFHGVAFGYLQHYPSHSYTLNSLGSNFDCYLAKSRLHEHERPLGTTDSWADFVIELARFERALREVFDAAGSEGSPGIDLATLSAIEPQQWPLLRLRAVECLRLARFEHPVHDYWAALKSGEHPPAPAPRVCHLAIHRRQFVVERHELSLAEYELLGLLVLRRSLGQAIQQTARLPGVEAAALERQLPEWFSRWTAAGYFASWST